MKNKIFSMGSIGMFLLANFATLPITGISINKKNMKTRAPINYLGFAPENITIKDDALHQPDKLCHMETWYFNAVFGNNFSMAIVVSVLQVGSRGSLLAGLYLYRDSELKVYTRKVCLSEHFHASQEEPFIKMRDEQILRGRIDNTTGSWIYDVSLKNDNCGVNLQFTKTAEGWKGHHFLGWWLVIPRLHVQGTITLDGKTINVTGNGYHDHNIYPIYAPFTTKGYHFARLGGNSLCITWAVVTKNRFSEGMIAILNQGKMNYLKIGSNGINFTVEESMYDRGELIPKIFSLKINNDRLQVNVTMETLAVHCIRYPTIKYWRYHLRVSGTITLGSFTEKIDSVEISELMRFC